MEILKKTIIKDIITNATYMLLVIIYFVCFNTQVISLEQTMITKYVEISSLTFLGIATIMLEVGYRNDKMKIFTNGIEYLVLAIVTLLIKHIPKAYGYTNLEYTKIITTAFIAYYIVKTATMYTKLRYEQLQKLSDIKEIVKEEPQKKPTQRKNKKEEGK